MTVERAMKQTYLTSEGIKELQEKLKELKTVRRREIADAIHSAKEQGDLSENAEYVSAKEEQNRVEQQIAELELTLKNAEVITKTDTSSISVGNTVTLVCAGKEKTYHIVGSNEADPLKGKVSNESPMGKALLGRARGEEVTIPTPIGTKQCKVVEIN
jgi:transcription elongation factor GreA